MKLIFVLGIAIFLSACAVKRIKVEDIAPASSIKASLPLDGKIVVFVPYWESEEAILSQWGIGEEILLEPGEDLRIASVDVASKYFSEADYFSLDKPTHYLLKLEGQATLDVIWGAYRTVVNASLYKNDGELVGKKEFKGSVLSGVVNDQDAFYNAYVDAVTSYFNDLFREHLDSIKIYVNSGLPKALSFDKLISENSIELVGTGSGFFVNNSGDIVTNYHVIKHCLAITVNQDGVQTNAKVIASDQESDVAVLRTGLTPERFAYFADVGFENRLGEDIITIGYPLYGVLSSKPNLTTGNISALAGLKGDERYLQISAPIQPGNSGGPLIGNKGLVYGVVQSKLNAILLAQFTGDIPQNVNFAVKGNSAIKLLEVSGVKFSTQKSTDRIKMDTPDIADDATQYTLQVMCHG
jgi:S1-C subfamily serine protease